MHLLPLNFSLEATAASLDVFQAWVRFAPPWLRLGAVPGGCASVRRSLGPCTP